MLIKMDEEKQKQFVRGIVDPQFNLALDLETKELAIYYTVEYFKGANVSEPVFMKHLEVTYNFLLNGKVNFQ